MQTVKVVLKRARVGIRSKKKGRKVKEGASTAYIIEKLVGQFITRSCFRIVILRPGIVFQKVLFGPEVRA